MLHKVIKFVKEVQYMSHEKFFKHFAYSMFAENGSGEYPDTDHINCPDCGAPMAFHGDDMNLPIGEEFWECKDCGFSFMSSDFNQYEYYYEDLECPTCGGSLHTWYQKGTGQPFKWECEECETVWVEDDNGDLVE